MDAGFDRAFRTPDNRGDFRQGEILEKMQHQHFAVPESDLIQGLMNCGGVLLCEGGFRRSLERRAVHFLGSFP